MVVVPRTFTTAIGSYPYTRPLKDGRVTSQQLSLAHVEVVPANRAFRPMVNELKYDISELALVTLLLARAVDRPLVGVPVVLMQQSAYGMLLVRPDSPLREPRDLEGRTIGVRAYTQTTGTWLRGMLHDQFGLRLDTLNWTTFEPAHVDGFVDPPNTRRAPEGKTLAGMLRDGEIDAAAGLEPAEYPDLRWLLPNPLDLEADFVRQTGIQPVNHTLVVRRDLVADNPWLPGELFRMVGAAKALVADSAPLDGLERNRGAIDLLARYAFEQRITPRTLTIEELFAVP
ncbi:MAG: ABC transporter substrate-binding protein [Chloroflexi bacterium]|nr:ABC transporter substrate-binding protein [Chloroflexota bacterium]